MPHMAKGETWIENEDVAYPNGGQVRRSRVIFPDGVIRAARCGIPDTFFSIPAHARVKGKYIRGYITSSKAGYEFRVYDSSKRKFEAAIGAGAEGRDADQG